MPSLLKQLQEAREADIAEKREKTPPASSAVETLKADGQENEDQRQAHRKKKPNQSRKPNQNPKRYNAHQEFHRAMAMVASRGKLMYTDHESLPSYEKSLSRFNEICPRYSETSTMDALRETEYFHIKETGRVCLDYCGFGLFSYQQQIQEYESSSFVLAPVANNLCSHALYRFPQQGTVECDIRARIMSYLKISEKDYSMVFTESRGASFKLLADAYPFEICRRLISMYDYESESVGLMVDRAKEKGAKVSHVGFKWPYLRVLSTELRRLLVDRRRRGSKIEMAYLDD